MEDMSDEVGYGFAVVKVSKKCPYIVVVVVSPK